MKHQYPIDNIMAFESGELNEQQTIDTINSEEESAFTALKKRCDASVLFSKNLTEITEAELAYIHAISGCYKEANFISSKFSYPKFIRRLCTHPECYLYIYEDGSLFDSNNAQSVVYCDYSDYVERVGRDSLTSMERDFFKIDSPDDEDAIDFVVNIRKFCKDIVIRDELAKDYLHNILTFATRNEARNWISENEPSEDYLYRCSYNEYSRPAYTIIAR